uniref:Uncharacterized protein n=1 Tax=viral metagenome TaxID=1070528 RepID=A0A6H1ZGC3_9ZZZZ
MKTLKKLGLEIVTGYTLSKYTYKDHEDGNYLINTNFEDQSYEKLPLSKESFDGLINSFELSEDDIKKLKSRLVDTKKEKLIKKLKEELMLRSLEHPNTEDYYYIYLEGLHDAENELKSAMNAYEETEANKSIMLARKNLKEAENEWERQKDLGKRIISLENEMQD